MQASLLLIFIRNARNVIFVSLVLRPREKIRVRIKFDQMAQQEKGGFIGIPAALLHVVRDDDVV